MRYGLFLGCAVPTRLPFVEAATLHVLERLEIEATTLQDMACCMDPIVLKSLSHDAWLSVAARNLSVVADQGCDAILTLCNGCFCSLNEAAGMLEDGPERERINETLKRIDRSYAGGMRVRHLAQLLEEIPDEKLVAAVERPLAGRRIATFHGCHLVRPSEHARAGDPVRPRLLDRIVERLGGECVDYTGTNECCGMGFAAAGPHAGAEALNSILERMAAADTGWIVTPCPSCFTQLESGQRQNKELRPMPVLHVAELCALAFGTDEDALGLKHHRVPFREKTAKV